MGKGKKKPDDPVWMEVHYMEPGLPGMRVRYDSTTRAEAETHPSCQAIHESDPTPPDDSADGVFLFEGGWYDYEGKRVAEADARERMTEAQAIKRGIHRRDSDHKREMHNRHSDRKLERDECTFVVDEVNPESGERHVETVYMKKGSGNWEKKRQVAEAYRRAGKQVEAHDITFFQE